MSEIRCDITDSVAGTGYSVHCLFSKSDIENAVKRLKPGKGDGNVGLTTDHFRFACCDFYVHMSLLFSGLLTHGSVRDEFSLNTVILMPEGRNDVSSDCSGYKGITLSSVFGKVLDLIILNRYTDILITSDLQFGFKAKRSTNMCTMVLKEAIDYYISNGSSVFCTLLDATKAFGRVDYCKLFRSLMNRNLPSTVLRLLLNMYTRQVTRVSWNGEFSPPFTVSDGVKQGGVLSPILLYIYIDSLLKSLAVSLVGCFIGRLFVDALVYADDIVLLSHS